MHVHETREGFDAPPDMLGEDELNRVPLVALEDIGEGSLWQKAKDSVLRMF
jgi:D-alanyl-D-alanine carboxypeptidase (penicillin-binding protein 5/6)